MKNPLNILLVEDNPADVRTIKEFLKGTGIAHQLRIAEDGDEALSTLMQLLSNNAEVLPDLVVLDLNLPKMNGPSNTFGPDHGSIRPAARAESLSATARPSPA